MLLLWKPDPSHLGLLQRSAWDDARGLEWQDSLWLLLREAYHGAERFNRQVLMIELKEGGRAALPAGGVSTDADRAAAVAMAEQTYVLFDRARKSLAAEIGVKEPDQWEA